MAKFIYNVDEVFENSEKIAHEALAELAEETFLEWKDMIKREVYEEGRLKADKSNEYYHRTGQFLESLELKWTSPLSVELYYNADKILPSMMLQRMQFNRHASFSGQDVSMFIPTFIEEGNGDSSIHSYEGLGIQKRIIENLNNSFHARMSKKMEQKFGKLQR